MSPMRPRPGPGCARPRPTGCPAAGDGALDRRQDGPTLDEICDRFGVDPAQAARRPRGAAVRGRAAVHAGHAHRGDHRGRPRVAALRRRVRPAAAPHARAGPRAGGRRRGLAGPAGRRRAGPAGHARWPSWPTCWGSSRARPCRSTLGDTRPGVLEALRRRGGRAAAGSGSTTTPTAGTSAAPATSIRTPCSAARGRLVPARLLPRGPGERLVPGRPDRRGRRARRTLRAAARRRAPRAAPSRSGPTIPRVTLDLAPGRPLGRRGVPGRRGGPSRRTAGCACAWRSRRPRGSSGCWSASGPTPGWWRPTIRRTSTRAATRPARVLARYGDG